jgi:tripartite-type tricarboxylate transporter receptor subunit TctC
MPRPHGLYVALAAMTWLTAAAGSASAQSDAFYNGKTVTIIVGYAPGGGYDQYARTLARYFGKHIPGNPSVVVEYLPGAATLVSVRHLDNGAPTNGTAITMFDPGLITSSLATPETTKIKLSDYRWIGTLARDQRVCYASIASGVRNWNDLMAKDKFIMGSTAKGADAYVNGAILRKVFEAHVVQIGGYPGSNDERLAVERGELDGNCAAWASLPPDWIANHRVNVFVRFSSTRPSDMPTTIPFITDLAATSDQMELLTVLNAPGELARPFIVSKSVPDAEIKILREAFQATTKDPDFAADLHKQSLPLDPIAGDEAEKVLAKIYEASPALIEMIKQVLE